MKHLIPMVVMPVVFAVGYILASFIHIIPGESGSNVRFILSVVFALLLTFGSFVLLTNALGFTMKQKCLSLLLSIGAAGLLSWAAIYYMLDHVGGG